MAKVRRTHALIEKFSAQADLKLLAHDDFARYCLKMATVRFSRTPVEKGTGRRTSRRAGPSASPGRRRGSGVDQFHFVISRSTSRWVSVFGPTYRWRWSLSM